MTLEQLALFVAVAERQHLTLGAQAAHRTPSAASAAIKALERQYGVALFDRVGRGLALTAAGAAFCEDAKAILARSRAAELALSEWRGVLRGTLDLHASQTVASYWLPTRLMAFHARYPQIEIRLSVGNTDSVARAVREGRAELGFVEGRVQAAELLSSPLDHDRLSVVAAPGHPLAGRRRTGLARLVADSTWIMREPGSGTRSAFEAALRAAGIAPERLRVALSLPSNEAVLSAVQAGPSLAAISQLAAAPWLESGRLQRLAVTLGERSFHALRHRERSLGAAAAALLGLQDPSAAA
ncbi:DNA-binding transcriptional LysR family regulator [Xanthomonas sacchari]|uniref:LysR family transcriptional regulator n=1 Tax=Xanthomonas sacchari TaxID=56458 RepID=UPI002787F04E|nr:LysR family transcriptional regulator [Xanthomonas sacchari]MDQ1094055.1 DNA-binding transcriptional LysR family regulator [Xanthomonas sacchari]